MDLTVLRGVFSGRLFDRPEDMAPFLTDWRGKWTGSAIAIAQPNTAEGVAAVLRWCDKCAVPVVPQGGNTGLSGGATPDASGRALVLSLAGLNKIRGIDVSNNTLEAEAGVTLLQVQEAAAEAGSPVPSQSCRRRQLHDRRQPGNKCRGCAGLEVRECTRPLPWR